MEPSFEKNLKNYSKFKNFVKFFCLTIGIWPDKKSQSFLARMIFRFLSIFAILSVFTCMGNYIAKKGHNLNVYMRVLGYGMSHMSFLLKVIQIITHQSKFEYLNNNISVCFENDIKDSKTQKSAMKHFSNISKLCWANSSCVTWSIFSLCANTLYYAYFKNIYGRIFPMVLPDGIQPGGTIYWLAFLFEFYMIYYSIGVTIAADGLFGYYVFHIVGELAVLRENYVNLKSSQNYVKDIKACVRKHLMIKESLSILEKIFGYLTVWHATSCQIIMCVVLFQVSKMKTITFGRALSLIAFFALKAIQTYSFGYYGYAITSESEDCLQAAYESEWPGSNNKQFMKDVVIVLSQKPMIFNAASLMNLNFEMFTKIMNASVSYYMILKTLESKY